MNAPPDLLLALLFHLPLLAASFAAIGKLCKIVAKFQFPRQHIKRQAVAEKDRERESVCLGEEKKNRKENKTGTKG